MTTPATHFEPHTAREVLSAFFPAHALHTVVCCKITNRALVLRCDCGMGGLRTLELDIKVKGWTMAQVKYALRNVPPEGNEVKR